jgi:hypothetical protein
MNRNTLRTMAVIACAVVMSLVGGSSWALVCPSPPPGPICIAQAGFYCSNADTTPCTVDADCPGGVCSAVVFGTPGPNGANVSDFNTDSPHLLITKSNLGTATASYRVHWDGFGSPFTGNITAINANGTCMVPVRYASRGNVAPNNEVLCNDGTYTFMVVSAPFWAAGQNVCASHIYQCTDGTPPTDSLTPNPPTDFPPPTTLFSVASPIHSSVGVRNVVMEMDKVGTLDAHLRLAFARSADHGATYGAFIDATTQIAAGSTRIIGTGEWSSVRAAVAVSPNNYPVTAAMPTLGEWGMIIMSLLLWTASSVLLARRRPALASSGPLGYAAPPLFVPRFFVRALTGTGALGIVAFAVLLLLGWAPSVTDVVGSSICAAIVAYQIHLWTAQSSRSPGGRSGG